MKAMAKTAIAALALVAATGSAYAQAFTFSFTGDSVGNPLGIGTFTFSGSGTGTTTGSGDPVLLTSIMGTLGVVGGQQENITGLTNTLGADNMISFNQPQVVSFLGVGFNAGNFGNLNIRFNGSTVDIFNEGGTRVGNVTSGGVTRVTAVPGPIAGAGIPALLAVAGALWVRRRQQQAVAA